MTVEVAASEVRRQARPAGASAAVATAAAAVLPLATGVAAAE